MENPFKSRPKVFVVDDEAAIAKMLAVILQMNLFDAVRFIDPQTALLPAKHHAPNYLISDVVMPRMNGIDLGIAIQREVPACKVLLFSRQVGAPEVIREAERSGNTFCFVQKPIYPKVLVKALQSL